MPPGADRVKQVAGYVDYTLRSRGKDISLISLHRVEPRITSSLTEKVIRGFIVWHRRVLFIQNRKEVISMGFFQYVKEEIQIIKERDPAIKSSIEVFLYPTFRVMLSYRRAHKLYLKGHYFRARWISQRAARKTGIEIHPGATIGKGFFIDHGSGVIIGETAIVGDNVTLYQGVTLGGTGKETGKRHPTLGDNVMVSAGAKIIGSFTVGENSKIGAGSVVIEEVPPNCTVVGVPGRIVKRDNVKVPRNDMDQIHLPDPVKEDIDLLQRENSALCNEIIDLENELRTLREEHEKCQKRNREREKNLQEK